MNVKRRIATIDALAIAAVLLIAAFTLSPIIWTNDWVIYYSVAQKFWTLGPIYGPVHPRTFFYNPAWVSLALPPFAFLPQHIGWSTFCVVNLILVGLLARRWCPGRLKFVLAIISPRS